MAKKDKKKTPVQSGRPDVFAKKMGQNVAQPVLDQNEYINLVLENFWLFL
jgi:hypothetical protein